MAQNNEPDDVLASEATTDSEWEESEEDVPEAEENHPEHINWLLAMFYGSAHVLFDHHGAQFLKKAKLPENGLFQPAKLSQLAAAQHLRNLFVRKWVQSHLWILGPNGVWTVGEHEAAMSILNKDDDEAYQDALTSFRADMN